MLFSVTVVVVFLWQYTGVASLPSPLQNELVWTGEKKPKRYRATKYFALSSLRQEWICIIKYISMVGALVTFSIPTHSYVPWSPFVHELLAYSEYFWRFFWRIFSLIPLHSKTMPNKNGLKTIIAICKGGVIQRRVSGKSEKEQLSMPVSFTLSAEF